MTLDQKREEWNEKEWTANLAFLLGDRSEEILLAIFTLIEQKMRYRVTDAIARTKEEMTKVDNQVDNSFFIKVQMLRQWLNERSSKKLLTTEDLLHWLK